MKGSTLPKTIERNGMVDRLNGICNTLVLLFSVDSPRGTQPNSTAVREEISVHESEGNEFRRY